MKRESPIQNPGARANGVPIGTLEGGGTVTGCERLTFKEEKSLLKQI